MSKNNPSANKATKAIWVTEKTHKKIKLLAVKANTTSLAIIETAIDLYLKQPKGTVDTSQS